jgi:AcrR family transcriptional regulator
MLADRMSQTMLSVGLDVIRHNAPADRVAGVLCRVMLNGLARRSPKDSTLDKSKALAAADRAIQGWADAPDSSESEADRIRAVARAEFGRRGYEITTIRDIAAVAHVGPATVIRLIGKKSEALASIMRSFGIRLTAGYSGVLNSDASPLEKMDALSWVHINALKYFPDEWKIQQAWMRQSPPNTANPGFAFAGRMRRLKALLAEGIASGKIRDDAASMDMLTRCVMNLLWMPENIVRASGPRDAHILSRDTWLRGIRER